MRKTILILLCAVLALMPLAAQAGVAFPGTVPFTEEATGRTVSVLNSGDEKFSYMTDLNGLLLVEDNDGYLRYVTEEGGAYALGGYVTQAKARSAGTNVNVNDKNDNLKGKLQALQSELAASRPSAKGLLVPDVPLNYDFVGDRAYGRAQVCTEEEDIYLDDPSNYPPMESTCPLLVLKLQFENVKCLFSDRQWHDRIFENGVAQYYKTVSNGKFTYVPVKETWGTQNDGVVTVTLPFDCPGYDIAAPYNQLVQDDPAAGLYTGSNGYNYAIYNMGSLFAYAMLEAESSVDFSKFDRDGDGFISPTELAVLVVYSGYEASYGGSQAARGTPAVWAHSWKYNNMLSNGDQDQYHYMTMEVGSKRVTKYTVIGEWANFVWTHEDVSDAYRAYMYDWSTGDGTPRQAQYGTASHELGHDMGLPDLYPTGDAAPSQRVNGLSLMASGSWGLKKGDDPGSSPTHLDPMSKIFLGFYDAVDVDSAGKFTLYATEPSSKYNILRINTDDPNVYYLVENRQYTGFDAGLGYFYGYQRQGGVVIWRVDQKVLSSRWRSNTVNNEDGHLGLMPVYVNGAAAEPFWSAQKGIDVTLQQSPLLRFTMLSLPGGAMQMGVEKEAIPAVPLTGDSFQPTLWIALGLAALAGAAVVCLIGRKKRVQEQK